MARWANALKGRGLIETANGRNSQVCEAMKKSYGLSQNTAGARGHAQTLIDLGQLDLLMDNSDGAPVNFVLARSPSRVLRDRTQETSAVRVVGDLEISQDKLRQGQIVNAEARGISQQAGYRIGEADALFQIGALIINQNIAKAMTVLRQYSRLYGAVGAAK
ncbi:MAG: hypothetical protein OSB69_05805 [Alphaproteobacteria bacterium]|nr:hypothetical protein [Alphaproteobacteria bacterium]